MKRLQFLKEFFVVVLFFAMISCDSNSPVLVQSVSITPMTLALSVGTTSQLAVTLTPSDAEHKSVTWSSGNEAVATVSSSGLVTGVAIGTTYVTAVSADGPSARCNVSVHPIYVSSITLDKHEMDLKVGDKYKFSTKILPDNATDKSLKWVVFSGTTSETATASIDQQGQITALKPGYAKVTVSALDATAVAGKNVVYDTCILTIIE